MIRSRLGEKLVPYMFLTPAVVLIFWWKYLPIFWTVRQSLFAKSFRAGGEVFAGLSNYIQTFQRPMFLKSIGLTIYFTIILTFIQMSLALCLALLVNRKLKGVGVLRSFYILPAVVAEIVAVNVWTLMFYPSGMLNGILAWFHIPPQPWLSSPSQALWSIILCLIWRGVGFWMVFYLAGLQSIEPSLYEVAAIDGSNRWQSFAYITWPLLKRTTIFILVTDTILNFMVFTPVYIMTRGGPMESTNLIMYEVYNTIVGYGDINRGAAAAVITLCIIATFVGIQFSFIKPEH